MNRARAPHDPPAAPAERPPPLACDAHVHMVAGPEYPLWQGRIEDPAEGTFDAWIERFERHLYQLGFERTVLVHSILYGADNRVTLDAVTRLGRNRARAVVLVTAEASDKDLDKLCDAGAVAVRLNYVHGGLLDWDGATKLAPRLADRGMHLHMLLNADRHMQEVADDIARLPVQIVFDHLGWPDLSRGIRDPGFQSLCRLVRDGHAWVKLSAIYRLCEPPFRDADSHVTALVDANPERCLWGSDWPHLMLARAPMPNAGQLLDAFLRAVPDSGHRHAILVDNPAALFGFDAA